MDARSNGTSRASSHLFRMKRDNNFSLCDLALPEVIKAAKFTRDAVKEIVIMLTRLNLFFFSRWPSNDLRLWSTLEGGKWSCTWCRIWSSPSIPQNDLILRDKGDHIWKQNLLSTRVSIAMMTKIAFVVFQAVFALSGCVERLLLFMFNIARKIGKNSSSGAMIIVISIILRLNIKKEKKSLSCARKKVLFAGDKHLVFVSPKLFFHHSHDVPILYVSLIIARQITTHSVK